VTEKNGFSEKVAMCSRELRIQISDGRIRGIARPVKIHTSTDSSEFERVIYGTPATAFQNGKTSVRLLDRTLRGARSASERRRTTRRLVKNKRREVKFHTVASLRNVERSASRDGRRAGVFTRVRALTPIQKTSS